jgi:hypothetical protein
MTARVRFSDRFDTAFYRDLPPVEEAYRALRGKGRFLNLLRPGLKRLADSPMRKSVGFFLLHRHFGIPPRWRIVETPRRTPRGTRLYVTSPTPIAQVPARARPYRFALRPGATGLTLMPLEYTIDKAVPPVLNGLAAEGPLLTDLNDILVAAGLDELLGITILSREFRRAGEVFSERAHRLRVTVTPTSRVRAGNSLRTCRTFRS